MEIYAGIGTLAEYHVERWLREAMILQIWEGTPHRQILDGMEVMQRKAAHQLLFQRLAPMVESQTLQELTRRVDKHLALSAEEKEAQAEELFRDLARFTAGALLRKLQK
jgi:hypothetical protein